MAETVIISSPSYALNASEPAPKIPTHVKKIAAPPLSASKNAPKASETTGVTKRKQSKSRNGMLPRQVPLSLEQYAAKWRALGEGCLC
jgi:hypothetical protein